MSAHYRNTNRHFNSIPFGISRVIISFATCASNNAKQQLCTTERDRSVKTLKRLSNTYRSDLKWGRRKGDEHFSQVEELSYPLGDNHRNID